MWSSPGLTVMIRHWPLNDRGKSRDLNLASDLSTKTSEKILDNYETANISSTLIRCFQYSNKNQGIDISC